MNHVLSNLYTVDFYRSVIAVSQTPNRSPAVLFGRCPKPLLMRSMLSCPDSPVTPDCQTAPLLSCSDSRNSQLPMTESESLSCPDSLVTPDVR